MLSQGCQYKEKCNSKYNFNQFFPSLLYMMSYIINERPLYIIERLSVQSFNPNSLRYCYLHCVYKKSCTMLVFSLVYFGWSVPAAQVICMLCSLAVVLLRVLKSTMWWASQSWINKYQYHLNMIVILIWLSLSSFKIKEPKKSEVQLLNCWGGHSCCVE